ncbi:hypothetical protein [Parasphingorhabdus sp.]|uniref:hypothetical protein n=1 Tax=Parasphingorhabdus sp. TaxID=2709688 RepID=UPI003593CDAB
MRKGEYRIRAQRFLTGEFNVEDLRSLFLFLRQNSYGNQTVRDIGDMVGHSDERNQGISLERISDYSDVMRYIGPKIARHPNNSLDLGDAPAELIPAMDATYNLIDDDRLLRDTGLRRDQTSTALTKLKR